MKQKKAVILTATILLITITTCICLAQQPYWLTCLEDIVTRWRFLARITLSITILTITLGIVIGILQIIKQKHIKIATAILGVVVSGLVSVKDALLQYDYATLSYLHQKGKLTLAEIYDNMDKLDKEQDAQLKGQYEQNIRDMKNKIIEMDEQFFQKVTHNNKSIEESSIAFTLLPRAYAQKTERPSWITQPPADSQNRFFVGTGADRNLERAKDKALNHALQQVSTYFSKGYDRYKDLSGNSVIKNKLVSYLAESMVQTEQYIEKINSQYACYILVKLNSRIIKSDLYMFGAFKSQKKLNEKFIEAMSEMKY